MKLWCHRTPKVTGPVFVSAAAPGISLHHEGEEILMSWEAIRRVTFFKIDLITVDSIQCRVELDYLGNVLNYQLDEDTEEFKIWVAEMEKRLPHFLQHWYATVVQPPFARNETIAFER